MKRNAQKRKAVDRADRKAARERKSVAGPVQCVLCAEPFPSMQAFKEHVKAKKLAAPAEKHYKKKRPRAADPKAVKRRRAENLRADDAKKDAAALAEGKADFVAVASDVKADAMPRPLPMELADEEPPVDKAPPNEHGSGTDTTDVSETDSDSVPKEVEAEDDDPAMVDDDDVVATVPLNEPSEAEMTDDPASLFAKSAPQRPPGKRAIKLSGTVLRTQLVHPKKVKKAASAKRKASSDPATKPALSKKKPSSKSGKDARQKA